MRIKENLFLPIEIGEVQFFIGGEGSSFRSSVPGIGLVFPPGPSPPSSRRGSANFSSPTTAARL